MLPIGIAQRTSEPTDEVQDPISVVVTTYADRVFVVVNQGLPAFGSIASARWDRPSPTRLDPSDASAPDSRTVDVRVLLGNPEDPLLHVYAGRILDGIAAARPSDDRGLLLSLALKRKAATGGSEEADQGNDDATSEAMQRDKAALETTLGLLKDCGLF